MQPNDLDHLAGTLAGEILERAGAVDVGRALIERVAGVGFRAAFAQRPGDLLDLLNPSSAKLSQPFRPDSAMSLVLSRRALLRHRSKDAAFRRQIEV